MAASPAIVGDEVIVHTMSTGHVLVLDRYNGRMLRRYTIGSPIESSPSWRTASTISARGTASSTRSTSAAARTKWTYTSGYKITSSAALYGGKVFIGDYGGRLLPSTARTEA